MKKILLLLLIIPLLTKGQSRIITHEILYQGLKKASGEVLIDFYSYESHKNKKFFNIGLITKNVINEPPEFEVYKGKLLQDDITTDSTTLRKIIEIFDNKGLLRNLYIKSDSIYLKIGGTDTLCENKIKLDINLFFPLKRDFIQISILIKERNTAVELLEIVSKLFDRKEQKLFKEMIDAMR